MFTILSRACAFTRVTTLQARRLSCTLSLDIGRLVPSDGKRLADLQADLTMQGKEKWALLPSWDKLFAGRRTDLTQRIEENDEEDISSSSPAIGQEEVKVIAKQGQSIMEAELQSAVNDQMPNAVPPPPPVHLAQHATSSSPRASLDQQSPGTINFPKVIRKSYDGSIRARSAISMPQVAVTSTSTAFSSHTVTAREGSSASLSLTVPQEAFHAKQMELTQSHVGELQRAGGRESSEVEQSKEVNTNYSDTPAGQWAQGANPATKAEADDLWETLSSLFGINSSTSLLRGGDDGAGFLGAVSHLQGILGESAVEQSQWKKEQEDDIKVLSQSSSQYIEEEEGGGEDRAASGVRHQPTYLSPRLPIVLAHGLLGFDTFSLAPAALKDSLPSLSIVYWRGITEVLQRRGVEVLVAKVPTSATIEERAEELRKQIEHTFPHREINMIGHSMGGLDCRFLASRMETTFTVRSVTTIATPHRGSPFADYMLDQVIGKERLPMLLSFIEKAGLPGGGRAFSNLTTYAMNEFNENVPDKEGVIYMSWGAAFNPGFFNEFRIPWNIINRLEGENDGLVSVKSSQWADYRGTLKASHLDLIGWINKVATLTASIGPKDKPYDPVALYLTICEDLSLKGL